MVITHTSNSDAYMDSSALDLLKSMSTASNNIRYNESLDALPTQIRYPNCFDLFRIFLRMSNITTKSVVLKKS